MCFHNGQWVAAGTVYRKPWPKLGQAIKQSKNLACQDVCGYPNRAAKMLELDAQLVGLSSPHAAIAEISFKGFDDVMENHVKTLSRLVSEHPIAIDRIAKAHAKYGLTQQSAQ